MRKYVIENSARTAINRRQRMKRKKLISILLNLRLHYIKSVAI